MKDSIKKTDTNNLVESSFLRVGSQICYHIMPTQDPTKHGGYVPSLIVRGQKGHCPMLGRGELAMPWVWGKTLEEAEAACEAYNTKRLGLDSETVNDIILSSMGD